LSLSWMLALIVSVPHICDRPGPTSAQPFRSAWRGKISQS
jgi:hypothetical protein